MTRIQVLQSHAISMYGNGNLGLVFEISLSERALAEK